MRQTQISIKTANPKKYGNYVVKLTTNDGREDIRQFTKYRQAENFFFRGLVATLQTFPVQDMLGAWTTLIEASLFQVGGNVFNDAYMARLALGPGFVSTECLHHSDYPSLIRIPRFLEKNDSPAISRCKASSHRHNSTYALQIFTHDGKECLKLFDCRQKAENEYFRAAAVCLQRTYVQTASGHAVQLRDVRLWKVHHDDYEFARSEILRGKAERLLDSSSRGFGAIEIPDLCCPYKYDDEGGA